MSGARGGGRGGGRGGRGASSGGLSRSGVQMPSMGTLTWTDLSEVDKAKPSKSYPPMEEEPKLSRPNEKEMKVIQYQLQFLEDSQKTIWWPVEEDKVRMRDVPRYSDRYRQDQINLQGDTVKATFSLKDESVISTLQKDAFPTQLWNLYMDAEMRRQEKERRRVEMKSGSGKKDWDRVLRNVENMASDDQMSDRAPSEDDNEDALDEYEDDEEDDYADNYFDNGEGDDIPEEGGEGAEETYE